jgi:hypothetical protein
MGHLNLVFNSGAPRRHIAKRTPFSLNGSPDVCCGCAKPFPLRDGHREALVGQDGRLYCFNRTLECSTMAMRRVA